MPVEEFIMIDGYRAVSAPRDAMTLLNISVSQDTEISTHSLKPKISQDPGPLRCLRIQT